ncbi:adenosine deaminase [Verruconis gallopava]|uniref:Adenine deaminase n=1 Tax=Verruconis gallopava TaxID=253628 RepID=A0A0D1YVT3_9PEZI|nr:adenosine deaminase [Verruconis gallopava]KIW04807.1 adenosine deaminase [Verruconis gallopava]
MCNTKLHDLLVQLPKCEHHIHIEGSLEPSLLFELAKKNGIVLPDDDDAFASPMALKDRYTRFTSLDDFLNYYYIGMSVLVHASDFEALAWAYFSTVASQGLKHAEIFFDPQAHLSRGVEYKTLLQGFEAARQRAEKELGITSLFICCFLRHLPPVDSVTLFDHPDVQASFENKQVVGIGLDSSELPFPPSMFQELYARADKQGLRRTAHAGEEGPAQYIRDGLDLLGIERIDHGLKLSHDEELMAEVAKNEILLSLCPVSNDLLQCVPDVSHVPIRKFLDAGVRFSINSDDPAYFGSNYILDNFCAVQQHHDLSVDDWVRICKNAIQGSWCSDARKDELLALLHETVNNWA